MYLLGFDVGSSSVKASIIDAKNGHTIGTAFSPKVEMPMTAVKSGWAEQEPQAWWDNAKIALQEVLHSNPIKKDEIAAIGISYQMHGLVCVDKDKKVLRPSIIWCDSRAVNIGELACRDIGESTCLDHLLNSPGNFTASKLKWVKENEPKIFEKIDKIMLPGDWLAMKLTGEICTTASGLSEGMFWDFRSKKVADFLMKHYGFSNSLIPNIVPTFSNQGQLTASAAAELGLKAGIPISYRAGDQPNNAFSLNVLEPGEIAATAGTSGVVYGVSGDVRYDTHSRVNTFAHVNYTSENTRLGVLLCVNGTGILNSWLKKNIAGTLGYAEMNSVAAKAPIGADGLVMLPFGNGAERLFEGNDVGAQMHNLNFNIHNQSHIFRAAQEGIVFSFKYGMDIMSDIGINPSVIRAGKANMFLSPIFRETLAGVTGATIELYNTDGAQGAARGAGIGCGIYASAKEAFAGLQKLETIEPDKSKAAQYEAAYKSWESKL